MQFGLVDLAGNSSYGGGGSRSRMVWGKKGKKLVIPYLKEQAGAHL
jgi:hypothetical protein